MLTYKQKHFSLSDYFYRIIFLSDIQSAYNTKGYHWKRNRIYNDFWAGIWFSSCRFYSLYKLWPFENTWNRHKICHYCAHIFQWEWTAICLRNGSKGIIIILIHIKQTCTQNYSKYIVNITKTINNNYY